MRPGIDEICRLYQLSAEEANEVLKMYDSANHNLNAFCLMGRRKYIDNIVGVRPSREEMARTEEYGGLSPDEKKFMRTTSSANFLYTDVDKEGNALATDKWNIAKNDAWVLGGIDAHCTFNVVFCEEIKNEQDLEMFVDECIDAHGNDYPLTVTAREILGLREAGYIPLALYGTLLFVPHGNVNTMSLSLYYAAVNYARFDNNNEQDKEYNKHVLRNYLSEAFKN